MPFILASCESVLRLLFDLYHDFFSQSGLLLGRAIQLAYVFGYSPGMDGGNACRQLLLPLGRLRAMNNDRYRYGSTHTPTPFQYEIIYAGGLLNISIWSENTVTSMMMRCDMIEQAVSYREAIITGEVQKRIAIYTRKSKYTGKGESIDNQIELCRQYVRLHSGEEMADDAIIFEDEGFSGGNLDRPAFKKMMRAAKGHQLSAIIVYRLDRISRNVSDFAGLINELTRLNVAFVSINEHFDTATPMGRAMMYIASVFSQLERETIAERIRDNMHELAKTGRWLGGKTPLGYCSESEETVTVDGKKKKAYKLKLVPSEAEIVRMIFELFLESNSLTSTEAELLKRHIKTKGGNEFTRFSIKAILQNPVYMLADEAAYRYFNEKEMTVFAEENDFNGKNGILAYNRTDQKKGQTTIKVPVEEWIVTVGKHPGIVSGTDWVKVQELLTQNKSKTYRRPRNNQALLTGLLYCTCGNRMYPKLTKRTTKDGEPVYSYVCRYKERSKGTLCNQRNVTGNILDRTVVEEIKHLEEDKIAFLKELEKSRKYYTGNREQYDQQLAALRKEHIEIERKIQLLVDSITELPAGTAKDHILERIERLDTEDKAIQTRITELEGLSDQQTLSDPEFDILSQLLTTFADSFDTMTLEQKRTAIRTVVRKVVWDGSDAHVILFGADEREIEYPPIANSGESGKEVAEEPLEAFSDVNYGETDANMTLMPHSCEDSK